jgi:hypothetical protein
MIVTAMNETVSNRLIFPSSTAGTAEKSIPHRRTRNGRVPALRFCGSDVWSGDEANCASPSAGDVAYRQRGAAAVVA